MPISCCKIANPDAYPDDLGDLQFTKLQTCLETGDAANTNHEVGQGGEGRARVGRGGQGGEGWGWVGGCGGGRVGILTSFMGQGGECYSMAQYHKCCVLVRTGHQELSQMYSI